jgi:hypothetical protein
MAEKGICREDGCDKPAATRGYCKNHYQNRRYHRTIPDDAPRFRRRSEDLDAFISTAIASDSDACILWPFQRSEAGRAYRSSEDKSHYVHVHVCEARHGPKPPDKDVAAHECGNGHLGCINPKHLSWKTHQENIQDAISHGTWAHGERVGGARFSGSEIMDMRRRWASGESQSSIGRSYGVAQSHIYNIITGKTWKHLPLVKREDGSP